MLTFAGHFDAVRCVAYSPDAAFLASGSDDGAVRLWDLGTRKMVWTSETNAFHAVESIAFTPNSALLLTGTSNGKLLSFAKERWKKGRELSGHSSGVRAILPHPDGTRVFTVGWDREVCVWPLPKPKRNLLCTLDDPPSAAALSPDGQTLAVGLLYENKGAVGLLNVRKGVHLIDTDGGSIHTSLPAGDGAGSVCAMAFSPDGSLLATGDSHGRVNIWESGKSDLPPRTLDGHTWSVYGLAFTPGGRRLVSAGADKTARIWDVESGQELHVYQWHKSWITCLAIAPDGLTVATGGADNAISVWDVPE